MSLANGIIDVNHFLGIGSYLLFDMLRNGIYVYTYECVADMKNGRWKFFTEFLHHVLTFCLHQHYARKYIVAKTDSYYVFIYKVF